MLLLVHNHLITAVTWWHLSATDAVTLYFIATFL